MIPQGGIEVRVTRRRVLESRDQECDDNRDPAFDLLSYLTREIRIENPIISTHLLNTWVFVGVLF